MRTLVESSQIAAVAYDPVGWCLEVQFRPNKSGEAVVWNYFGVSEQVYEAMLAAPSIGRAFASIKSAYSGRKVATIREDGIEVEA